MTDAKNAESPIMTYFWQDMPCPFSVGALTLRQQYQNSKLEQYETAENFQEGVSAAP
jgi:hypothetical protein